MSSLVSKLSRSRTYKKLFSDYSLLKETQFCSHLQKRFWINSEFRAKRNNPIFRTTKLNQRFNMEWPKITLFGDSITRRSMDPDNGCWGSMIAYKVGEYFDVDARGFEGYNTKWALQHMEQLFPRSYLDKVQTFVHFFGHNDSWKTTLGLGIPVEEYEKNVRAIIKYLNDNGLESKRIILITPTWFHREATQRFMASQPQFIGMTLDKSEESAMQFSEVIKRIGKDNHIDVVDFFKVSFECQDLESMFCDGIHLSRSGARMLYDILIPVIEKKIEASFKRPLGDLYHLAPYDQVPEVKRQIDEMMKRKLSR